MGVTQAFTKQAKNLGAFYTDEVIAKYLLNWAIRSPQDKIMDPSFGGGVFLNAATKHLTELGGSAERQIFGVELDAEVFKKVGQELQASYRISVNQLINSDFFALKPTQLQSFDAVVGNPPFIRYQQFKGKAREQALACAQEQDVTLSSLASSWAAFLIHSAAFLKAEGRLAMVLPMELGHAAYARPVLDFLYRSFGKITLLTFQERLFPQIYQDTLLLLAEAKGSHFTGLFWRDYPHARNLIAPGKTSDEAKRPVKLSASGLSSGREKLRRYFISEGTFALFQDLQKNLQVSQLKDIAEISSGYVTGANNFFHLSPEAAQNWRIPQHYLTPAVFRSRALKGIKLSEADWWQASGKKDCGYVLTVVGQDLAPELAAYLQHGEAQGVHQTYKCKRRKTWFKIARIIKPDAFLSYMSHTRPALVANEANAAASNTLHTLCLKGLKTQTGLDGKMLAALWQSSLTSLSVELSGHALGDGLLKLEPSEAKNVLIANPQKLNGLLELSDDLDELLRRGRADKAKERADKLILQDLLGLSKQDCHRLKEAAITLQKRRYAHRRSF